MELCMLMVRCKIECRPGLWPERSPAFRLYRLTPRIGARTSAGAVARAGAQGRLDPFPAATSRCAPPTAAGGPQQIGSPSRRAGLQGI